MTTTFSKILGEWKERTGWTEKRIAAEVGVSRAAINQWLNDKSSPDIRNLPALGKLLRRDWMELAAIILGEEIAHIKPMRPDLAALLAKVSSLTPSEINRLSDMIEALYPEVRKEKENK